MNLFSSFEGVEKNANFVGSTEVPALLFSANTEPCEMPLFDLPSILFALISSLFRKWSGVKTSSLLSLSKLNFQSLAIMAFIYYKHNFL